MVIKKISTQSNHSTDAGCNRAIKGEGEREGRRKERIWGREIGGEYQFIS